GNIACLWDLTTGAEVRRFLGHEDWINSIAFSPDSRFVLTGSGRNFRPDKNLRLWDITNGEEVDNFGKLAAPDNMMTNPIVWAVAYSPDGRLALSGGNDNIARLWDISSGTEIMRFVGHSSFITAVAFSPDGRFVLTGSNDGSARLWDAA